MSTHKSELHTELQRKLRENISCRYHDLLPQGKAFHALVTIVQWQCEGTSYESQLHAQQNAAAQALLHVQAWDEEYLRGRLGLPHRPHLTEFDGMRDCLRHLRQRYKSRLGQTGIQEANTIIGKFYQELDRTESILIDAVGLYD